MPQQATRIVYCEHTLEFINLNASFIWFLCLTPNTKEK